jgi:hypothetical protein
MRAGYSRCPFTSLMRIKFANDFEIKESTLGGLGSGRHSGSGKGTTSHFCALDVRHLQRKKLLEPGCSFTWQLARVQKIRVQLGGHAGLDYPFPSKPKWMHWRTYHRLNLKGTAGSRFTIG